MADFVHSSRSCIRVARTSKGAPSIRNYEASTAVSTALVAYGQVVSFDLTSSATHRLVRCSTAAGANPILTNTIAGISAGADTSDGSTLGLGPNRTLPVYIADPDTEFLFPTKLVIASTMIGVGNNVLLWDSTLNIHHLGVNSTAGDARAYITGIDTTRLGDTGGFVYGRFFSSAVSPIVQAR